MKNYFDVSKEVVLITGGSGQLGLEYTKTFLDLNAKTIVIDIVKGEEILKLEKKFKNNFKFFECDITDKKSLKITSDQLKNYFGNPTVLINNAGIDSPPGEISSDTGPFEKFPESSWEKIMDVNLKGVFNCCQVFGRMMSQNKKGSIINISSIYGIVSPDQSLYEYKRKNGEIFFKPIAYSVSKSGLSNMTKYLAVYWAKNNVRVNTLVIAGIFNSQEEQFLDAYCNRIPIGRMANQDEYNGAVIFLASEASKYMTGSELIVDGGWTSI